MSCIHWRVLHHNRVQFFDSDFGDLYVSLPKNFRHGLAHQTLRLVVLDRTVVGGLLGLLGVLSLEDITGAL